MSMFGDFEFPDNFQGDSCEIHARMMKMLGEYPDITATMSLIGTLTSLVIAKGIAKEDFLSMMEEFYENFDANCRELS